MNNLLSEIKYLANKSGLRPQRQSGQNFLIDWEVLQKIIQSANLSKQDRIIEIGAGFGILTRELAERTKKVWAIELEKRFIPPLRKLAVAFPAVEIIKEDVLKVNIGALVKQEPYKLVANIPYNITSQVLRRFLEQEPKPSLIVFLIQKEVAERIVAEPGNISLLSVSVQLYGNPKIVQQVDKRSFWPQPQVDSVILKISGIKNRNAMEQELKELNITEKELFQVARVSFSARRKQIHNNLTNGFHADKNKIIGCLQEIGLDPAIRAQNLLISDWKRLTSILKKEAIIKF